MRNTEMKKDNTGELFILAPHGWGGYVCHLFCLEPCLPTLPTNG